MRRTIASSFPHHARKTERELRGFCKRVNKRPSLSSRDDPKSPENQLCVWCARDRVEDARFVFVFFFWKTDRFCSITKKDTDVVTHPHDFFFLQNEKGTNFCGQRWSFNTVCLKHFLCVANSVSNFDFPFSHRPLLVIFRSVNWCLYNFESTRFIDKEVD